MRATTAAPSLAVATRRNAPLPVPSTRINRWVCELLGSTRVLGGGGVVEGRCNAPLPVPATRVNRWVWVRLGCSGAELKVGLQVSMGLCIEGGEQRSAPLPVPATHVSR